MKVVVEENCFAPERMHPTDAGLDLRSPSDMILHPGEIKKIDIGNRIQLPHGFFGWVATRSSLFSKGINTCGIIDENYRGHVKVVLHNTADDDCVIYRGDKIAQLIIIPCSYEGVEIVDEFDETDRGHGGFGSTGR